MTIKKDNLKWNITANFMIRLWSAISNFIFVPLYIKFLGEEAFGLVTFFSTLQTIMNLLGMGLSKTLRREFASIGNTDKLLIEKYKLLRSVEFVYGCIALLIIFLCFFGANFIATKWLSVNKLPINLVSKTIVLMGVSIAIQMIASMLQGCLFGLEKQVEADIIQFFWSFVRNVGVILLMALCAIDLISFYLWYIALDVFYLTILRIRVINFLKKNNTYRLSWNLSDISNIRKIWKYAFGLFFISICTIGFDKVIISKSFDLITIGAYNTIVMLGNFSLIISTSVGIAVFSRFAILKSENKMDELRSLYKTVNRLVNFCVGCLGSFIAVFSNDIILFWTNSTQIAQIASNSAELLILGFTFLALQQITYEYMLSTGVVFFDNIRAIITVVALLAIMPLLILRNGFFGAAEAVFGIFSIIAIVYVGIINEKYINRNAIIAILEDMVLPLVIPWIIAVIIHSVASNLTNSNFAKVLVGVFSGACTLFVLLYFINMKNNFFFYINKEK